MYSSVYILYTSVYRVYYPTKWFDDLPMKQLVFENRAAHFELWKVLETQDCRFLREQKTSTCGFSKLVVPEMTIDWIPRNREKLCITRDLPRLFG